MSTATAPARVTAASGSSQSRPELLAPAGDFEAMRAAVANGADAVYFGLNLFNARHRATNFSADELPEVMNYLHDHNVRGYVAFNTLIFSDELPDALALVRKMAEAGVDAVIVQDLGLASLIRRMCPGLHVHGSTQMTLTEPLGVEFVRSLGVRRVILARELSAKDVRQVTAGTDLPVEVFVHGALCVSYSGQCLTSEAIGGRSANRGQCAQACRLPYDLIVDGQHRDLGEKAYLLSPQDLAAYDMIGDLADAGVCSLKIEGRLKSPHYVAATTQTYRAAIDAYASSSPFRISRESELELAQSFSRGFTHGFLDGVNHQGLVHARFPKSRGVRAGRVVGKTGRGVLIQLEQTHGKRGVHGFATGGAIKPGDGLVFDEGHPEQDEQGGRAASVTPARQSWDVVEVTFQLGGVNLGAVSEGAIVWKTDDPSVRKRLESTYARERVANRVRLTATVHAAVGQVLSVAVRDDAGHEVTVESAQPLEAARKFPLTEPLFREQFGRMGDSPFELGRVIGLESPVGVMAPKSVLNDLRRDAVAKLVALRDDAEGRTITDPDVLEHVRAEIAGVHPPVPSGCSPDQQNRAYWDEGRPPLPVLRERQGEGLPQDSSGIEARLQSCDPALTPPSPGVPGEGEEATAAAITNVPLESPATPHLHVLVRTMDQLRAVLQWKCAETGTVPASVSCDFEDIRKYKEAVPLAKAAGVPIGLATVRIIKPGEHGLLRQVADCSPDFVLIRNLAGLAWFSQNAPGLPLVGDYALNVANEVTASIFAERGIRRMVPSYDLNWSQVSAMLSRFDPGWFEAVIHQHMPMFHMEHCVFCHTLSTGTSYKDCGRPCDDHKVDLRDRAGAANPLIADVGCRNTVYNGVAQTAAEFVPRMLEAGIRHFRVELLRETAEACAPLLDRYARVLEGKEEGRAAWRKLKILSQIGVTRGTLED